ncbi:MAG: carbohydrate-binding domain-containing protein [Caldilineaceae bacterium]|nr:carbohydrate-binding domain-containing protein [Caldilineaceae bacterium]
MGKRQIALLLSIAVLVGALVGWGKVAETMSSSPSGVAETFNAVQGLTIVSYDSSASVGADTTVIDAIAENADTHDSAEDYTWQEGDVVAISLNGDSITAAGTGVRVDGSTVTITAPGTYSLSGTLTDGQIVVDSAADGDVYLVLNGVDMRSSTSAPIFVADADEVVIVLAPGTENYVADAATYIYASAEEDEPNAAIFSKSDLTIYGEGSLVVVGNYNDAIASKDGLIIASGNITATAADDGIRGKDYLIVKDGVLTVTAQGDGLKSDNEEDATLGYILIENGSLNIAAGGDAIQAVSDVMIADGEFVISAGGGSNSRIASGASAKGIKATVRVVIDGGTFTIDAADDAIHANDNITLNGGSFAIASGDDGVHADATLTINGGDIDISRSYEGIESAVITVNGGDIHIVSSDDGLNGAGGVDGSGMAQGFGGRPGQNSFVGGNYFFYMNGGRIVIDAAGDGVDVNGSIVMTGGVVLVNGPTEQMNGALDYDGGFQISGGLFVAVGSAGMAQAPDTSSTQYSVLVNTTSTQQAGTLVHLQSSSGEDIVTFAPSKAYQSILISSPELSSGETYQLYLGGSVGGEAVDGLYTDAGYSGGTQYTSLTLASVVTQVGGGGGRMMRR